MCYIFSIYGFYVNRFLAAQKNTGEKKRPLGRFLVQININAVAQAQVLRGD